MDWACGAGVLTPWRQRVCEGLAGSVVEIGFGSGRNVPYYPSTINVLYAVEPSRLALKLAVQRIDGVVVPVEHIGDDAQAIALSDETCDAALSSFTLCTVDDPAVTLQQIWRVLKPGGEFHFLEHGLAPTPGLALVQRLVTPAQRRLGGGCHLNRQPLSLIRTAGFEFLWSVEGPAKGPKPWCYVSAGVAIKI